jgi:hypothetical protein
MGHDGRNLRSNRPISSGSRLQDVSSSRAPSGEEETTSRLLPIFTRVPSPSMENDRDDLIRPDQPLTPTCRRAASIRFASPSGTGEPEVSRAWQTA